MNTTLHEKNTALFQPEAPDKGALNETSLIKGLNEALLQLLNCDDAEQALENAFQVVCGLLDSDGIFLLKYQEHTADKIIASICFGMRIINGKWERLSKREIEFPVETVQVKERINKLMTDGIVFSSSKESAPPALSEVLSQLDVDYYMSFRILVNGHLWGGGTFTSRRDFPQLKVEHYSLLDPFMASVGNFLARIEAETALSEKSTYLRKIIDLNPNLIFAKDSTGAYTLANKALAAIHGVKTEDMIGKTDRDFKLPEEEVAHFLKTDLDVMDTRSTRFVPIEKITDYEGNIHFFQTTIVPIFDKEHVVNEILGVCMDITDLKKTEAQLIREKQFSENITSTIPDWVMLVNYTDGRLVYHNITYPVLGYNEEEVPDLLKFLESRIHPEDQPEINQFFDKLSTANEKEIVEKRFRLQHKNGEWLHFFERARVVSRKSDGSINEYLAIIQNVTKQVAAKKNLIESKQRYRNFIAHSYDGIYYLGFDTPISIHLPMQEQVKLYYEGAYVAECNQALARMYGYQHHTELIGVKLKSFHDGEYYEQNAQSTIDFISNGYRVLDIETIEPHVDGEHRYYMNYAIGMIENEYLVGVWGAQQDITERKKAEWALRESESILKATLNALPDLKFRLNKEGIFLEYFRSASEGTEPYIIPNLFLGKSVKEALPPYIAQLILENLHEAIAAQHLQVFEYDMDGEYFEGRISPMRNEEVIAVVRNITPQKKAQMELEEKIKEVDHKNKELIQLIDQNFELQHFASVASHDLREPIRTIHSFVQLLEKRYYDALDEDGIKWINFIKKGTSNMNQLIEDLLMYARINSDEHSTQPVPLATLLNEVLESIHNFIQEKKATVKIGHLPAVIHGNRTKFKQLLQNLITNAIKFHKPGTEPQVELDAEEMKDHWKFMIKDNGLGIREGAQENIFMLFKKIHSSPEHQGTGIGLALCKRIVEQHGGTMWVASSLGVGSTFYFTIRK